MIDSQWKSVLAALSVAGLCLAVAAPAAAQDEAGDAGDAGDGGPVALEPASAGDAGGSREPLISGSTVDVNDGLWIAGGVNLVAHNGSDAGFRIEVGLPIVDLPVGRLSVYLPFVMHPNHFAGGDHFHTFIIDPGVRYEVSLLERYGRLSIFGDFGFGVWIDQQKVFGSSSSLTFASMRFATGASFTFPFGLFLILEPVGVVGRMGHNPAGGAVYEYSLLVGYRF